MNDYYPFEPIPPTDQPPEEPVALDLRRECFQPASAAFAVSFISLFTIALQFIIVSLVKRFAPQLIQEPWFLIVASMVPMYAVAMPLSLLLYRLGRSNPPSRKRLGILAWFGILAITFAITYVGSLIGVAVNMILEFLTGKPMNNELQELTSQTPLWANLLFVGILAPILEEIFYRKLIIDRLRRYGDLIAILFSGLLFGLIHGNFHQVFYATLSGILFGYVYVHTGKLRYTVALHMSVNLLGGVIVPLIFEKMSAGNPDATLLQMVEASPMAFFLLLCYFFFILLCFVTAPIAIALFWKHIRFQKGEVKLSPETFTKIFLLNPPVWILCIIVLANFFI